jgi:hypothetical protein
MTSQILRCSSFGSPTTAVRDVRPIEIEVAKNFDADYIAFSIALSVGAQLVMPLRMPEPTGISGRRNRRHHPSATTCATAFSVMPGRIWPSVSPTTRSVNSPTLVSRAISSSV